MGPCSEKNSKIKMLDIATFAFYFDTPCSEAVWISTSHALSWKIFLPAQEADTETKTLKDLNAFVVPTDLGKP